LLRLPGTSSFIDVILLTNSQQLAHTMGQGDESIIYSTMGSKWDIEKFTRSNDSELWKVKMREVLIQNKCVEALKGEAQMLAHLTRANKSDMNDKAMSAIILFRQDILC
jgi:hypothetical protein